MARPGKLTANQRAEVLKAFEEYLGKKNDPTVVGFVATDPVAVKHNVSRDNINDWREFSTLRKRAIAKQEAWMLEGGTRNRLNASLVIFRLKQPQHGYSDKQQVDHTTKGQPIPLLAGLAPNRLEVADDATASADDSTPKDK